MVWKLKLCFRNNRRGKEMLSSASAGLLSTWITNEAQFKMVIVRVGKCFLVHKFSKNVDNFEHIERIADSIQNIASKLATNHSNYAITNRLNERAQFILQMILSQTSTLTTLFIRQLWHYQQCNQMASIRDLRREKKIWSKSHEGTFVACVY